MKKKIAPLSASIKKRYRTQIRHFLEWCENNDIEYTQFENADKDDICVLSMNDYDIGERRYILENNDNQYFLKEEDYETFETSYSN